jgi:4a-hydroxytetrahydrobiopterin dehydratase
MDFDKARDPPVHWCLKLDRSVMDRTLWRCIVLAPAPENCDMADKLDSAARDAALAGLNGWIYDAGSDAISRDFKFKDFSEAFGFMARVALAAQQADHHPDWTNSYNRVSVTLSTHSAGGLTSKDVDLAAAIDRLLI